MKKEYEAPKAEKMEFDYEENVVASGDTEGETYENGAWIGRTGKKTGCTKKKK